MLIEQAQENMMYRRATLEDAEPIARVHVAGWQVAYDGVLPEALLKSLDASQRMRYWQQCLRDHGIDIFVAIEGNEVGGFCACAAPREADEVPHAWELRSIYLLPALRGKGIGKSLFDLAVQSSRQHQATTMILWVAEKNRPARGFYASRGMLTDGIVHTHAVSDGAVLQRVKYTLSLE